MQMMLRTGLSIPRADMYTKLQERVIRLSMRLVMRCTTESIGVAPFEADVQPRKNGIEFSVPLWPMLVPASLRTALFGLLGVVVFSWQMSQYGAMPLIEWLLRCGLLIVCCCYVCWESVRMITLRSARLHLAVDGAGLREAVVREAIEVVTRESESAARILYGSVAIRPPWKRNVEKYVMHGVVVESDDRSVLVACGSQARCERLLAKIAELQFSVEKAPERMELRSMIPWLRRTVVAESSEVFGLHRKLGRASKTHSGRPVQ